MTENIPSSSRQIAIDNAKLVCLYLIMFCHIPPTEGFFHSWSYSFHVPVFFLIAGAFFSNKSSYKDFIIKNVKALLIPYLVYNTALIIISSLISIPYGLNPEKTILQPLIGMLTGLAIPGGPSWFLLALFFDRIIFKLLLDSNWTRRIIICIILILIYLTHRHITSNPLVIFSALLGMPFMIVGYAIKDLIRKVTTIPVKVKLLAITLGIVCVPLSYINGTADMFKGLYGENIFLFIINGILGSLMIICMCSFYEYTNKTFRIIIQGSLFFICCHMMIMEYVMLTYRRLTGNIDMALSVLDKIIVTVPTLIIIIFGTILLKKYCPAIIK